MDIAAINRKNGNLTNTVSFAQYISSVGRRAMTTNPLTMFPTFSLSGSPLKRSRRRKKEAEREKFEEEKAARALVKLHINAAEVDFQSRCIATQTKLSSEDVNYMEECLNRSV